MHGLGRLDRERDPIPFGALTAPDTYAMPKGQWMRRLALNSHVRSTSCDAAAPKLALLVVWKKYRTQSENHEPEVPSPPRAALARRPRGHE